MNAAATAASPALKRILFVDDEPNVLRGLQRMLRPMRGEWQMDFVTSGGEALAFAASHQVDVVVTDMRMPGMDGVTLLERLAERHPRVVRIVLSGHAERESVLRGARVAHQYLSKPCEPDVLRTKLSQAFGLRALLGDARLNGMVSRLRSLPTLPAAYREALAGLDAPAPALSRAAAAIARDPGMTATVLQLANATGAGDAGRIATTREAVERLGFEAVRGLLLSMTVLEPGEGSYDVVEQFGRHARLTARCAARIAADLGATSQAAAGVATAGLLHDIGRLVLADALGTPAASAPGRAELQSRPPWEREFDACGATHTEVGAYLLGLWGFPEAIVAAAAWHHRPSEIGPPGLITVTAVHAGDAIAQAIEQRDDAAARVDWGYLQALGLEDALPRWTALCAEHGNGDA